jgi:hypothetical protein
LLKIAVMEENDGEGWRRRVELTSTHYDFFASALEHQLSSAVAW